MTQAFKSKEAHEKKLQTEQDDQIRLESTQQKHAKEVYMKQVPDKAQEAKMKKKVEHQVQVTNTAIVQQETVQREKKEKEQTKHSEEEKAKTLKKLQVVEARQEKYNAQVKEDDKKLKKMGHKIALKEASAQTNTKDLTEKLGLVKTVHESAIQALQAFQESKKESTPDPQAQNAAALAIRTTHSKLQVSIREAEF